MASSQTALRCLYRTVSIAIDPNKTTDQLIAYGKYDWVNAAIREYFGVIPSGFGVIPSGRCRRVQVHLLHYNRSMSNAAVLADMDRQGLRPATLVELAWLSIKHPRLRVTIVALGIETKLENYRRAASLYRVGRKRYLDLPWLAHGWDSHCRFAAIYK